MQNYGMTFLALNNSFFEVAFLSRCKERWKDTVCIHVKNTPLAISLMNWMLMKLLATLCTFLTVAGEILNHLVFMGLPHCEYIWWLIRSYLLHVRSCTLLFIIYPFVRANIYIHKSLSFIHIIFIFFSCFLSFSFFRIVWITID